MPIAREPIGMGSAGPPNRSATVTIHRWTLVVHEPTPGRRTTGEIHAPSGGHGGRTPQSLLISRFLKSFSQMATSIFSTYYMPISQLRQIVWFTGSNMAKAEPHCVNDVAMRQS
jgi:hypothetical protein